MLSRDCSLHHDIVPLLSQGRALLLHWTSDHTHYEPVLPRAEGWRLPGVHAVTGADLGSGSAVVRGGRSLVVDQGAIHAGSEGEHVPRKSPRLSPEEPLDHQRETVQPSDRAEPPRACITRDVNPGRAAPRATQDMINTTTPHDASIHMPHSHRKCPRDPG